MDVTKLNTHSDYLVVLVGTYNRLELLKKVIDSIHAQTKYSHEIIVIDVSGHENSGVTARPL